MTSEPSGRGLNAGSPHTSSLYNGYLRNQDQLLSRLLNDLVAAAYADRSDSPGRSELVTGPDLSRAGRYRRWLVTWLVAWRFLAVGLAAALWLVNPGRFLKGPMTWLVHLFAPHTAERCSGARQPDSTEPPRQAMARAVD